MTDIKSNLFQNSSLQLPLLELLKSNSDTFNVSSPTNTQIKYYQSPSLLKTPIPNASLYSFINDEEYDYSPYDNAQTINRMYSNENINYLNQENICQTPTMDFNYNNPNIINDVQNHNDETNFQKSENITYETNTSSKSIQLNPEFILPKIENIVSTANLHVKINLREIALQLKNAEYNPKRFSAVIMKIKEPRTTGLIFSNGKIVCLGAKNEEESKRACRKFAKIIKSMGYPAVFKEFEIQNIVGSADTKSQLSLTKLYIHLMKKIMYKGRSCVAYEPEQFPGLIYRMIEPNIVILIFSSGKLVITGGKKRDDIFNGFKKIYPLLIKFKIENKLVNKKELYKKSVEEMKEIKEKEDEMKEN